MPTATMAVTRHAARAARTITAASALVALVACSADGGGAASAGDGEMDIVSTVMLEPGEEMENLTVAEQVERRYVIGPVVAKQMNYRIDWQHPSYGRTVRKVAVADDSVFTLDERNFLTRLRRADGDRVWRIPAAQPVEAIFGISYVPGVERVFLITGGEMLVLDAASGSRIAKQRLDKTANTAAIVVGGFLVYGSRDGQVVWHAYQTSSDWRAYQVSPSIQIAPLYDNGYLVAVGSDGRVMTLAANSASQVWSRQALDSIVAVPTAGDGVVYVASLDQHIRAYELSISRAPLWEYLTESPLVNSPVLIKNRLYQQVPTEGVVCFEAVPLDSPGGVVIWRCEEAKGNVLTRAGDKLIAWDGDTRHIELIDVRLGSLIDRIPMPHVDSLFAAGTDKGEIYATADDGRVTRLESRR